jgi:hypothetical protein
MKQGIPSKIEMAEIIIDINRIIPLRGTLGDRVSNVVAVFGKRVGKLKAKRLVENVVPEQPAVADAPQAQ